MSKNIFIFLILLLFTCCTAQKSSDVSFLEKHLINITKSKSFRNHSNIKQLNSIASYIKDEFALYADSTSFQNFEVNSKTYKNVICSFGTENKKRIIVGAHYDVAGNQEGADDNASGIAGLLELARLLKGEKLNYRIDLVAYSLEEPPYFRTKNMGSFIHAQSLVTSKVDVYGMVSLEMIGYFTDANNSQLYTDQRLSQVHGTKGDFIALVNGAEKKQFATDFGLKFTKANTIKTVVFDSSSTVKGVDFSDHLNYWNFNISALMVTDTAFLRNSNYHQNTDTLETLDIPKMAKVINGVYETLLAF